MPFKPSKNRFDKKKPLCMNSYSSTGGSTYSAQQPIPHNFFKCKIAVPITIVHIFEIHYYGELPKVHNFQNSDDVTQQCTMVLSVLQIPN